MFKKGDALMCIEHFRKVNMFTREPMPNFQYPIKGEIYTCNGFNPHCGGVYLAELGHVISYNPAKFRKLSDIQSEELLNEITRRIQEEELILEN